MCCFMHRIVLLGIVLPLGFGEIENYCNLCENGKVHTLCKYPKEGPGPLCRNYPNKPLSLEDKAEVLLVHNELRNKVAKGDEIRGYPGPQPSASNMRQMSWDNELEKIAQRWADQCVSFYQMEQYDECRNIDNNVYVAQNVGASRKLIGSEDIKVISVITGWYDTVRRFNSNLIDSFNAPMYPAYVNVSRYVRLMWGTAYRLGCARVIFDEDNGLKVLKIVRIVCNYGPTSPNLFMNSLYKIGVPCSQCPDGTSCSLIYPALCATREQIMEYIYIYEPEDEMLGQPFPMNCSGKKKQTWKNRYDIAPNGHFKINLKYLTKDTTNITTSALSSNTQSLNDFFLLTTPPENDSMGETGNNDTIR